MRVFRTTRHLWIYSTLVLAWCFASLPHSAGTSLIIWLQNAEHFSHQQRLMVQTLATLTASAESPDHVVAKVQSAPRRATPSTPLEGMSKSEWLFAQDTTVFETIAFRTTKFFPENAGIPDTVISDTPHPPPRDSAEAIIRHPLV